MFTYFTNVLYLSCGSSICLFVDFLICVPNEYFFISINYVTKDADIIARRCVGITRGARKHRKQCKKKKERDDYMATATRKSAFVIKASRFERFAKESNQRDIDKIYAMAEKFEKITNKEKRK